MAVFISRSISISMDASFTQVQVTILCDGLKYCQPMIWKYNTRQGNNTGMLMPWVVDPVTSVEVWKFWKNRVMFYKYEWPKPNIQQIQGQNEELDTVRKWLDLKKKPSLEKSNSKHVFTISLVTAKFLRDPWQTYLSESRKDKRHLLKECHDKLIAGHLSISKTIARIRSKFYWPGLIKDVRRYIHGCDVCA